MNPTDQTLLSEAIAQAQCGEKLQAYVRLKTLLRTNPKNLTVLLWIVFTAPNLVESELALAKARLVDPNYPDLTRARKWLDAALEAHAQTQLQAQPKPAAMPVPANEVAPQTQPQPVPGPEQIQIKIQAEPLMQPESQASLEIIAPVAPAPEVEPEEKQAAFASNWAEYYPHLDPRVPVPAWARPVTMVASEPEPAPPAPPAPEVVLPPLTREPSRLTKMVKGFFVKPNDTPVRSH